MNKLQDTLDAQQKDHETEIATLGEQIEVELIDKKDKENNFRQKMTENELVRN